MRYLTIYIHINYFLQKILISFLLFSLNLITNLMYNMYIVCERPDTLVSQLTFLMLK